MMFVLNRFIFKISSILMSPVNFLIVQHQQTHHHQTILYCLTMVIKISIVQVQTSIRHNITPK